MDSRRCQLITQAYLRGYLRKDYPLGQASRLREQLILDALDSEWQADARDRENLLAAALIGGATLEGPVRKQIMVELQFKQERNELLRLCDYDGISEHRFVNSSLAAETVHGLMREAGLLGDRSADDTTYDDTTYDD